jgi:thiol-disulfide isomerase/thioredoxin
MSGVRFGRRQALAMGALGAAGAAIAVSQRTAPSSIDAAAGAPTAVVRDAADLPVLATGGAPSVAGGSGWLNADGDLTDQQRDADLGGRVVLYDFWTFGCINCRNTLGHTTAWHDRYAPDGLVLLSIHTPEFEYERDPDAVAEFVADEGIRYPVVLDPDKVIWRRWTNRYWPAFYLYDADGALRRRHFGEGRYDEMEDAVRALLGVDPSSPRVDV